MKKVYQSPEIEKTELCNFTGILQVSDIPVGGEGSFDVREETIGWDDCFLEFK